VHDIKSASAAGDNHQRTGKIKLNNYQDLK